MRDVWLDRVLHRRLSAPVSRAAVRLGVSPNVVTGASLVVGLAGGLIPAVSAMRLRVIDALRQI